MSDELIEAQELRIRVPMKFLRWNDIAEAVIGICITEEDKMSHPTFVVIDYTNWRGERAERRIRPICIHFESNEWLLHAECLDCGGEVNEVRTFALANVHSWRRV